ncbi:MAG: Gfo/Idh/MocA family protein [Planctomycetota bacterium]
MAERAVVVGAGGISRAWFPPLKEEGVEIPAVVDLDRATARQKIADWELDAEATDDLAGALRRHRPDFVVDLTVPEAHCEVTCTALRAGCHVIGEKPMASSMDEARRMVRAAEESGKCYMVSQSRRWDVHHDRVRRAVREAGQVGRVTAINCDFYIGAHFGGFRAEMPSPLILDMAIHHFDLARYMTGADPVAVYCQEFNPAGSWYNGDAAASAIFEMTDGAVFTYRGSWCSEGFATSWNGNWRIQGEKGALLYENDRDPQVQQPEPAEGSLIWPGREVDVPESPLTHPTMHGGLREMLQFLRTGQQPQTECHDNIKSLAMVFAAMQSSREGRRVEVRPL